MPVINPKIEVKVEHFRVFCYHFNIQTDKIAGNDGFDIELIIDELNKFKDEN